MNYIWELALTEIRKVSDDLSGFHDGCVADRYCKPDVPAYAYYAQAGSRIASIHDVECGTNYRHKPIR